MMIPSILNYVTADINLDVSILSGNDSLFTNALTTERIRDGTAELVYQDHRCCLLRLRQESNETTVDIADRNMAVQPVLQIFIQHITQAAAAVVEILLCAAAVSDILVDERGDGLFFLSFSIPCNPLCMYIWKKDDDFFKNGSRLASGCFSLNKYNSIKPCKH